jgi:hypothetical protein
MRTIEETTRFRLSGLAADTYQVLLNVTDPFRRG